MALDSVFFAVKTCEKFHATRGKRWSAGLRMMTSLFNPILAPPLSAPPTRSSARGAADVGGSDWRLHYLLQ